MKSKNLAIIPARGGSKRIPRKNIKDFLGKPIIAYSIEAALQSGLFDEVMVSTEDQEIAEIAVKYGAKVPFMRSKENADDFAGPGDVVFEVLREYEKTNANFDLCCCIYATSPLIKPDRIKQAVDLLNKSGFDVVFPVGKFSSPIRRSYNIDNDGRAVMNFPEFEKYRSQDLPNAYFDAGQFYCFYTSGMEKIKNKNSFGNQKGVIILDDIEVQDIDDQTDWEIAELKYTYLNSKK